MSPPLSYDGRLKANAQRLRRNMTESERALWYRFLRNYPAQFRRQKQFGYYIVDFYCGRAKLVVELDGSQHYDPEGAAKDRARDAYLRGEGLAVLRFSNLDVEAHFEAVCAEIDRVVRERMTGT